jgi:hypothetical protein
LLHGNVELRVERVQGEAHRRREGAAGLEGIRLRVVFRLLLARGFRVGTEGEHEAASTAATSIGRAGGGGCEF